MALTATVTQDRIISKLCMEQPFIVLVSPHKKSIVYFVEKKASVEEFVQGLADLLHILKDSIPKTLIFCRRYEECCMICTSCSDIILAPILLNLQESHIRLQDRLVDMYARCQDKDVKEDIIKSFCDQHGCFRIVL